MIRAEELPNPSFTIAEVESYAGLSEKYGFALIKQGKLKAHTDVTGKFRVTYDDLYSFLRDRERRS